MELIQRQHLSYCMLFRHCSVTVRACPLHAASQNVRLSAMCMNIFLQSECRPTCCLFVSCLVAACLQDLHFHLFSPVSPPLSSSSPFSSFLLPVSPPCLSFPSPLPCLHFSSPLFRLSSPFSPSLNSPSSLLIVSSPLCLLSLVSSTVCPNRLSPFRLLSRFQGTLLARSLSIWYKIRGI